MGFADTALTKLSSATTILVGLVMALWVLYFAAKLFLPFGAPGSSHWNVGASKLFQLLFVMAFLQTSGAFWNYVFTPVLSSGLTLAAALADAADSYESHYGNSETMPKGTNSVDYCSNPPSDNPALTDNTKTAYTALLQMDCPLSKIQSQYAKGIMIGAAVIGQRDCSSNSLNLLPSAKQIEYLLAGAVLIGLFGFGFLVFPFLLLDVVMRVVLVAAIAPLAIASILFKPTVKIAERSLWSLIQCGFTLMFGAAIAGIGKAMMAYILLQISPLTNNQPLDNWNNLTTALELSCNGGFHIDFSSAAFYMLCGTAMLMIFMMRRASSLASELTGIAGSVGAQAAAAAVMGAAAGAAGKAGQMAVNYALSKRAYSKASQVTGNSDNGGDTK